MNIDDKLAALLFGMLGGMVVGGIVALGEIAKQQKNLMQREAKEFEDWRNQKGLITDGAN